MKTFALVLAMMVPVFSQGEEVLPLEADAYKLTLTHVAVDPTGFDLSKVEYRRAKKPKIVRVIFSDKGKTVEIQPNKISGELTEGNAVKRVYSLSEGLFAGGELVIEKTEKGLMATFTEFGSGVPVISSDRGLLAVAAK